ncbi:MAG: DUF58 domain-containing protein [Gammaproteobacteria bacterium]|nr:DUF58 domain-containing protein [Gammaproteobacteria bacterium]
MLNGRHASRLRGRGLNVEEMRNYLPGDDIRSIDWKATARTGKPHVSVFTEERDRPALFVVDQRMSMFFGSQHNMKSTTAAEAAALIAFSILGAGDRVGGIAFDDDTQVELRPKRRASTLYVLLEAIAELNAGLNADRIVTPAPGGLNNVLKSVSRLAQHDHTVLVFSDFDGIDEHTHQHLSGIAAHNDVLLILVYDPLARSLEPGDRIVIGDGDMQAEVDLGEEKTRELLNEFSQARLEKIFNWQNKLNLSVLPLSAGEETLPQIRNLMGQMSPRRRVR